MVSGDDDEPSDAQLIARAGKGGPSACVAFKVLVGRHQARLRRLALGLVRNSSDAEEVVQDAFLNAFRRLDSFRGDSSPSTWLSRIATNSALMRLRTRRRKPLESTDGVAVEAETPLWPAGSWRRDPEMNALNSELHREMERAMAELPLKYRVALLLRTVEELSNEEIARTIRITTPNAKTRVRRARLMVRAHLEGYVNG